MLSHSELILVFEPMSVPFHESDFPGNHPGLVRIFNQYAIESFPNKVLPVGVYDVKRTKLPFRQAAFTVKYKGLL
jgi:hypothetical protein